jgi:hypothetical protein
MVKVAAVSDAMSLLQEVSLTATNNHVSQVFHLRHLRHLRQSPTIL